jgi:hypothetical protein
MQQHAITVPHTARRERPGGCLDPGGELRPGPGLIAPDDRGAVGEAARGLQQQMREIAGRDQRNGSRIET